MPETIIRVSTAAEAIDAVRARTPLAPVLAVRDLAVTFPGTLKQVAELV